MKHIIALVVICLWGLDTFAQNPPRIDDHFWRRKVLYRINFEEKINKPIITQEHKLYEKEEGVKEGNYEYQKGLVVTLMDAFKKGELDGFQPDTLNAPKTFLRVKKDLEAYPEAGAQQTEGGDSGGGEAEEGGEYDEEGGEAEEPSTDNKDDVLKTADQDGDNKLYNPLTYMVEIVEDRIFDKNKSDMYYDKLWIRLVAYDVYGKIPDKVVVAFRYKDLLPILEKTLWKNRFNDAEYRSLAEVFEDRIFTSITLSISGVEVQDLLDSYKKTQQMVEFEHHLWEF